MECLSIAVQQHFKSLTSDADKIVAMRMMYQVFGFELYERVFFFWICVVFNHNLFVQVEGSLMENPSQKIKHNTASLVAWVEVLLISSTSSR